MQGARHLLTLIFVPTVLITIFVIENYWLAGIELAILFGLIFVIFKPRAWSNAEVGAIISLN